MYAIRLIESNGHNETRYYGGTDYNGWVASPRKLFGFVEASRLLRDLSARFPSVTYKMERHARRP